MHTVQLHAAFRFGLIGNMNTSSCQDCRLLVETLGAVSLFGLGPSSRGTLTGIRGRHDLSVVLQRGQDPRPPVTYVRPGHIYYSKAQVYTMNSLGDGRGCAKHLEVAIVVTLLSAGIAIPLAAVVSNEDASSCGLCECRGTVGA